MAVRTLTESEQRQLLNITRHNLRDQVILLLALKTGLRSFEILALNVGDVFEASGKVKWTVILRPEQYKGGTSSRRRGDPLAQSVGINHDTLRAKLAELYKKKLDAGHDMTPSAPLFVRSRGGGRKTGRVDRQGRLTTGSLRTAWRSWQKQLGWDPDKTRFFHFHDLRRTAITRYAQVSNAATSATGLKSASRFARHRSMKTTEIYLHASEEEYMQALKRM